MAAFSEDDVDAHAEANESSTKDRRHEVISSP